MSYGISANFLAKIEFPNSIILLYYIQSANFQVKRMVTKNKAVNYSVIPEAVNENDTADTLAGRNQCDEDDYG